MVVHFLTSRRLPICNQSITVGGHGIGSQDRAETTCKRCRSALAKADARRERKAARVAAEVSAAPRCAWFGRCERTAAGTLEHQFIGNVPTCERCAEIAGQTLTPFATA